MEKLIELRKRRQLSQSQLAELTGIPKRTIESWEQGKRRCNKLSSMVKLANALKCSIDDLIEQ